MTHLCQSLTLGTFHESDVRVRFVDDILMGLIWKASGISRGGLVSSQKGDGVGGGGRPITISRKVIHGVINTECAKEDVSYAMIIVQG